MSTTTMKLARMFVFFGLEVCGLMSISQVGWAQTEPVSAVESYHERWRVFKSGSGTKDVDPNVYVYTPEFAKRFQMPTEWVSTELKGADAVAFRVTPTYASCGWGGNPKACRTDEVRCDMDVYFDHKRNPLPWDERYPEVVADPFRASSRFIPALNRKTRLPKHPNDVGLSDYSPFVDLKTGKGLGWQYFTSLDAGSGWGLIGLTSYDREIFPGVSIISIGASCNDPVAALALASHSLNRPFDPARTDAVNFVLTPQSWQSRVQVAIRDTNERNEAFFKREGEKAMKVLREPPVPNKAIDPMQ